MQSFLLHEDDGEASVKRTDELHEFLKTLCGPDTPVDFEGHNSGITISLHVEAGDTILIGDDDAVRVLQQNQPVVISRQTFPAIHRAMVLIEVDNGGHLIGTVYPGEKIDLDRFKVPYEYGTEKIIETENALRWILERKDGRAEFQDFVTGDQDEQYEYMRTHTKETNGDIETAHALLNDWFNGWEKTP